MSIHRPRPHSVRLGLLAMTLLGIIGIAIGPTSTTTAQRNPPSTNVPSGPPPAGSKNPPAARHDGPARPPAADRAPGASPAGGRFLSCGQAADSDWSTTSSSLESIRSCTLELPEDGFVYMTGSTSLGIGAGGGYEGLFRLGIDTITGIVSTDRWVNVYTDTGDGTDKSSQVTVLASVISGTHTFHYLGARYAGTGTVQLHDPSLSILYFPNASSDIQACGVASNTTWTTTQNTFQEIRSCTLNVAQSGFVWMSGTASVGVGGNGASEARFRVGVDDVGGTTSSDRWINVYTDSGDGTDESVATAAITSVVSGTHTFYFSAMRSGGDGTVQLYDPTLSVLYFPTPNVTAKVCGSGGADSWTSSSTTFSTIRSCSLKVPSDGIVFMEASAAARLNAPEAGNDYEGQFRLSIDDQIGIDSTDRWVNVYTDSGDGTDRVVADTLLTTISAGVHTFSFIGQRNSGSGTVRLSASALTVLVPGARMYIPRMNTP